MKWKKKLDLGRPTVSPCSTVPLTQIHVVLLEISPSPDRDRGYIQNNCCVTFYFNNLLFVLLVCPFLYSSSSSSRCFCYTSVVSGVLIFDRSDEQMMWKEDLFFFEKIIFHV